EQTRRETKANATVPPHSLPVRWNNHSQHGDYHRFIVFPVRTIVIASLMLHIQSDSSDSGLKSESFITTLHSQAS
ncbi:LOW QUALITY PROTEIN: predicted protein, partial [Brucella abortus bv. 4 str. 292]